MLALVLITSVLLLIGSYAEGNRFLVASFALAMSAVFSYTGMVSYAVSSSCPTISSASTNTCINGPFGSQYGNSGWTTWGFESGFYLFLVGGFLTLGAVVLHRIFFTELEESPKETRETSHPATAGSHVVTSAANCSACGKPLVDQAKFCPNCGNPVAKVQPVSS